MELITIPFWRLTNSTKIKVYPTNVIQIAAQKKRSTLHECPVNTYITKGPVGFAMPHVFRWCEDQRTITDPTCPSHGVVVLQQVCLDFSKFAPTTLTWSTRVYIHLLITAGPAFILYSSSTVFLPKSQWYWNNMTPRFLYQTPESLLTYTTQECRQLGTSGPQEGRQPYTCQQHLTPHVHRRQGRHRPHTTHPSSSGSS